MAEDNDVKRLIGSEVEKTADEQRQLTDEPCATIDELFPDNLIWNFLLAVGRSEISGTEREKLSVVHRIVFRRWLSLSIAQQTNLIGEHVWRDEIPLETVKQWSGVDFVRRMVPNDARQAEVDLFMADVSIDIWLLVGRIAGHNPSV